MKAFFAICAIITALAIALGIYAYAERQKLLNAGLDRIIRASIPSYARIQELSLDMPNRLITAKGLTVANPYGFKNDIFLQIENISLSYEQTDSRNILSGITLKNIKASGVKVFLEKNSLGLFNAAKMEAVLNSKNHGKSAVGIWANITARAAGFFAPKIDINQLLRLEPVFDIDNGAVFFNDYFIDSEGYRASVEKISAKASAVLKRGGRDISSINFDGSGIINNEPGRILSLSAMYDFSKSHPVLNNNINIKNADIKSFGPYYDEFSPFIFHAGTVSGRLVINIDNELIDSSNELVFSNLELENKKNHGFNRFWPSGADDLYSYFSSEQGDILFDFKVKGAIDKPEFYLGPKTKQALAYMVIDKIAGVISGKDEEAEGEQPKEDESVLSRVINAIKGL
ncbi:MAG: DUF748 domain-containing protein [Candidatus Omnitrophica bacterium]|nr:DUF748 domain-containing protein [Candidatus Omnitrophota bacterium]